MSLVLRKIHLSDCLQISKAFALQGWTKPEAQYQTYFQLQESGKRDIIVAEKDGDFAGYLTIKWISDYPVFKERDIPEIVDFNVLQKYQRQGIGTALMDDAESRISKVSSYCGIRFGVTQDYGAAQVLYIKRGYIPDGNGLAKETKVLNYGDKIVIDDDVAFALIKTF
ncbi:MAG: GNAT family N-acetyltransferase [Bacteroidota bacterium]